MRKKFGKIALSVVYLLLVVFQISTTNIKEAYSFTPHQKDLQIRRMNMYPPGFARAGYILEAKKEVQTAEKLISNLFFTVDFREYFPNRIPYLLSPFLFVGLYFFISERRRNPLLFGYFAASVLIMSVLGPFGKYGPVLMMVFLYYFLVKGIFKVVKLIT